MVGKNLESNKRKIENLKNDLDALKKVYKQFFYDSTS